MIRFAWLQSRTQTLTAAALVGALAVVAAITGIQLSHLSTSLVAHCHAGCHLATTQFESHDHFMANALDLLALVAPALIGIFWGAPLLARELETGTYRLAWTQSVSRSRWLVTKIAVVGLLSVTAAALLTLTITWWYRALDTVSANQYDIFDRRDIAPIAYAAFAFASGALIGAVIRRTLPAMATSLGVYAFARITTTIWIRPHLLSPTQEMMSLQSGGDLGITVNGTANGPVVHLAAHGSGPANSWTLSSHVVTKSGQVPSPAQLAAFVDQYCSTVGATALTGPSTGPQACITHATKTFRLLVTYQPANRYWTFQWLESGIFLAAAIVAAIGCYWWVTRHTS